MDFTIFFAITCLIVATASSVYAYRLSVELKEQKLELKELKQVYVHVYHEEKLSDSYFFKKQEITVYCQYYLGQLQVGAPILVKKDTFTKTKEENVKECLNSIVSPLVETGVKVFLTAV